MATRFDISNYIINRDPQKVLLPNVQFYILVGDKNDFFVEFPYPFKVERSNLCRNANGTTYISYVMVCDETGDVICVDDIDYDEYDSGFYGGVYRLIDAVMVTDVAKKSTLGMRISDL